MTYGSPERITQEITHGGFSKHVVVRQEFVLRVPEFVLRVPDGLDLARRASRRPLYRMNDRALADIGLTQADLGRPDAATSWQRLLPLFR